MAVTPQGSVLKLQRPEMTVLVVSKAYFNRSEQVIACPLMEAAAEDPLHIPVSVEGVPRVVLCEQMRLLDLRVRGFRKAGEISLYELMNVTDAIQGIFDTYPIYSH